MPLGARDILLVIRAKDAASHVVLGLSGAFTTLAAAQQAAAMRTMMAGSALLGLGAATAAIGAVGVAMMKGWVDEAIKYRQESALTLTQVDRLGVSLGDIEQIGLRVANEVPVAFDQIQASLFDIFSSMDVSLVEAEVLLKGFAKAAVAGQTDIQTAGRATIAIMNAWKLPVSELNNVLDFQFRLVQKGVGTYEEFAKTIGRAIPSARRAGQEYTTLGGVLAFLTRNGLSTAMAATSAARAMDSLAHPTVQKRLQDMGISVYDLSGGFRQIDDVAADLGRKLAPLTDPEKAKALQELFMGAGGTIQARRFWDLAIRNFDELNARVDEMINSSGSLEQAYKLMFEQPASQAQLLDNRIQALKISFGQALIPVFMEALKWISRVVEAFNNLDPGVKAFIAKVLLIGFALMTLMGIFMAIVGAILLFVATISLLGGIAAIAGLVLKFLAVLSGVGLAIAALAFIIHRNWSSIKAFAEEMWPGVRDTIINAWNAIWKWAEEMWPKIDRLITQVWDAILAWAQENWPIIRDTIIGVWDAIWGWVEQNWPAIRDTIVGVWDAIWGAVETAIAWFQENVIPVWDAIYAWAVTNWPAVRDAVVGAWEGMLQVIQTVMTWISENIGPIMEEARRVWDTLGEVVQIVWEQLFKFYEWIVNTFGPGFMNVWNSIAENVGPIISSIAEIISMVVTALVGVSMAIAGVIAWIINFLGQLGVWEATWNMIRLVVETAVAGIIIAWNFVTSLIALGVQAIRFILEGLAAFLSGDFSGAWNALVGLIGVVWQTIVLIVSTALQTLLLVLSVSLAIIAGVWAVAWNGIQMVLAGVWAVIQSVVGWGMGQVQAVITTAMAVIQGVWTTGWNIMQAIVNGILGQIMGIVGIAMGVIQTIISTAVSIFQGVWTTGWTIIQNITSAAVGVIKAVIDGIRAVLEGIVGAVQTLQGIWNSVWGGIAGAIGGIVGTIVGALGAIVGVLGSIVSMAGAAASAIAAIPSLPSPGDIADNLWPDDINPLSQSGRTMVPPGGSFISGERGPELVRVGRRGATVITSNRTLGSSMQSGGGATMVGTLIVNGGSGSPEEIQAAVEEALMSVIDRDRARRPR